MAFGKKWPAAKATTATSAVACSTKRRRRDNYQSKKRK
jgi:hypothetical protein